MKLLGSTYRPGPRKNSIFSIDGPCAPGGVLSSVGYLLSWGWYCTIITDYISVPSDRGYMRARVIKTVQQYLLESPFPQSLLPRCQQVARTSDMPSFVFGYTIYETSLSCFIFVLWLCWYLPSPREYST
jgi:hypothetical protein